MDKPALLKQVELRVQLEQLQRENVRLRSSLSSQLVHGVTVSAPQPSPDALTELHDTLAFLASWPQHNTLDLPVVDMLHALPRLMLPNQCGSFVALQPLPAVPTKLDVQRLLTGDLTCETGPLSLYTAIPSPGMPRLLGLSQLSPSFCIRPIQAIKGNPTYFAAWQGLMSTLAACRFQPQLVQVLHTAGATAKRHGMASEVELSSQFGIACHCPVVWRIQVRDPEVSIDDDLEALVAELQPGLDTMPGLAGVWRQLLKSLMGTSQLWLGYFSHHSHCLQLDDWRVWKACMRDHMSMKYCPVMVAMCDEHGCIMHQNAVSIRVLGVQGVDQVISTMPLGAVQKLRCYQPSAPAMRYLQELLGGQAVFDAALATIRATGIVRQRVLIGSKQLLSLMGHTGKHPVYHDVSITQLLDGVCKTPRLIVSQVDVSETVRAEQRLERSQRQQVLLLEQILPHQVIDTLLSRQLQPLPAQQASPLRVVQPVQAADSPQQGGQGSTPLPTGSWSHPHFTLTDRGGSVGAALGMAESLAALDSPTYARLSVGSRPGGGFRRTSRPAHGTEGGAGVLTGADAALAAGTGEGGSAVWDGVARSSHPTSLSWQTSHGTSMSSRESVVVPSMSAEDVMGMATWHDTVSMLFTDIKGFTSMSQQLHPSQVMLFLNHLYSLFDALVEQHDVYKVETIGDCYVVAAGLFDRTGSSTSAAESAPQYTPLCSGAGTAAGAAHPAGPDEADGAASQPSGMPPPASRNKLGGLDADHATKMMAFAKAMAAMAASVVTPLGEAVQMRVGIHTGPIMTGVVGRKMPRFCCFGDTVNTASRMESTGSPGFIHVSQAFRDCVPEEAWVATGGVQVKGKGLMQTYMLACD